MRKGGWRQASGNVGVDPLKKPMLSDTKAAKIGASRVFRRTAELICERNRTETAFVSAPERNQGQILILNIAHIDGSEQAVVLCPF